VRRNVLVVIGVGLVALALGLGSPGCWPARSPGRCGRSRAPARRVEDGELDARADITGASEQREVAIAFNDMTERLEESIQAQREFVGNASHQLRTPLTGLRLRLEAAEIKADDPAGGTRDPARRGGGRAPDESLNSLLTLARGGDRPVVREPVSLRAVSEAAHERWLPRAEATAHTLARRRERRIRAGRGGGRGDRSDNLIENALVYAPARNDRDDLVEPGRSRRRARRGPGHPPGERSRSSSASAAGVATGRVQAWGSRSSRRSPGAGEARRRSGTARPAAPRAEVRLPSTARPATWSR
jgi:signal transduction histidine kinase